MTNPIDDIISKILNNSGFALEDPKDADDFKTICIQELKPLFLLVNDVASRIVTNSGVCFENSKDADEIKMNIHNICIQQLGQPKAAPNKKKLRRHAFFCHQEESDDPQDQHVNWYISPPINEFTEFDHHLINSIEADSRDTYKHCGIIRMSKGQDLDLYCADETDETIFPPGMTFLEGSKKIGKEWLIIKMDGREETKKILQKLSKDYHLIIYPCNDWCH